MTLSLTQAEANTKLQQISDAQSSIVSTLQNISSEQEVMLGSNWIGSSATKYGQVSSTQQDDMQQIINAVNQIVETATSQIKSVTSADQG